MTRHADLNATSVDAGAATSGTDIGVAETTSSQQSRRAGPTSVALACETNNLAGETAGDVDAGGLSLMAYMLDLTTRLPLTSTHITPQLGGSTY